MGLVTIVVGVFTERAEAQTQITCKVSVRVATNANAVSSSYACAEPIGYVSTGLFTYNTGSIGAAFGWNQPDMLTRESPARVEIGSWGRRSRALTSSKTGQHQIWYNNGETSATSSEPTDRVVFVTVDGLSVRLEITKTVGPCNACSTTDDFPPIPSFGPTVILPPDGFTGHMGTAGYCERYYPQTGPFAGWSIVELHYPGYRTTVYEWSPIDLADFNPPGGVAVGPAVEVGTSALRSGETRVSSYYLGDPTTPYSLRGTEVVIPNRNGVPPNLPELYGPPSPVARFRVEPVTGSLEHLYFPPADMPTTIEVVATYSAPAGSVYSDGLGGTSATKFFACKVLLDPQRPYELEPGVVDDSEEPDVTPDTCGALGLDFEGLENLVRCMFVPDVAGERRWLEWKVAHLDRSSLAGALTFPLVFVNSLKGGTAGPCEGPAVTVDGHAIRPLSTCWNPAAVGQVRSMGMLVVVFASVFGLWRIAQSILFLKSPDDDKE